jgi:copper homeostasis protein
MVDGITLEVCIENGTRIDELIARRCVDRVELNDNIAVGGTTVSYGVAENVIRRCHAAGITVMSMVRPRGGNFVYDKNEFAAMLRDLEILKTLGTDGVVFGCLTAAGSLDREKNLTLIKAGLGAGGIEAVFHMAFDHINSDEQLDALRWLANNGIKRVRPHGSADQSSPIEQNYKRLREYVAAGSASGIEILPGGGITGGNYREVCEALGVKQAHGTKIL